MRILPPDGHYSYVFYRRKLPHLHVVGVPFFVTWRLYGSLPKERAFSAELTSGQAFVAMDRLLDNARTGPLYLKRPEIAEMVVGAILHGVEKMYDLHAWVVMSNHVHLLITPRVEPAKIMKSLKRFTAREANKILGMRGSFWQDESYDRLIRDSAEFERVRRYIEFNPVRAGLVQNSEHYRWSSAAGCKPAALWRSDCSMVELLGDDCQASRRY